MLGRRSSDWCLARVASLWGVVAILAAGPAPVAGAVEPAAEAALVQTYYDFAVAEYCGLVTQPVYIGFFLLRHDQLARGKFGAGDNNEARRVADLAADLEYFDRGLSGQKNWCRTEGAVAVARFTSYFQRRELP